MSSKTFAPSTCSSPVPGRGEAQGPPAHPEDLQASTHMGTGMDWETGMILLEGKDPSTQSSQAPHPSHLPGIAGSGVGFIKEQHLSKKA